MLSLLAPLAQPFHPTFAPASRFFVGSFMGPKTFLQPSAAATRAGVKYTSILVSAYKCEAGMADCLHSLGFCVRGGPRG